MRPASKIVIAGVVLGALGGAVLGASHLAGAQSQGGSQAPLAAPTTVNITTPDGGAFRVGIDDSVRLDVSATTPPDTWLAIAGDSAGTRLQAEVTGLTGASVVISGSVELGPTSAALLAGRVCVYQPLGHLDVGTTAVDLPGMAGRTGIQIVAHNFGMTADYASCMPGLGDGGLTPNCTTGADGVGMPIHEGGSASFDVNNSYVVRCISCAHGGGPTDNVQIGGVNSQCTP